MKSKLPITLDIKFISRLEQFKRNLAKLVNDIFTTDSYMDIDIEVAKLLEKGGLLELKNGNYKVTEKFTKCISSFCKNKGKK